MNKKHLCSIFFLFILSLGQFKLHAQFSGANDSTFNAIDKGYGFGDGSDGSIYTTSIQSDHKIIIGGMFNTYNGTTSKNVARLLPNGELDSTFNTGTGANSSLFCTAVLTNNKIMIGGMFSTFNGANIMAIARLLPNGKLDTTFHNGSGASGGTVNSIKELSSGKILAAGSFTNYAGTSCNRMVRINTDGTKDTSFNFFIGPNFIGFAINDINVQPDNKILIAGNFLTSNGALKSGIARLNQNGSIDTTFHGSGTNAVVGSIDLQPDGKIVIGGGFTSYNGTSINRVARLNSDGSLDNTFNIGSGSSNTVNKVKVQNDGKVLVGGTFSSFAGNTCSRIARLNSNGSYDNTFAIGSGVNVTLQTINITQTNEILIAGDFTLYNDTSRNRIAMLYQNGAIDLTFNQQTGANGSINKIVVQPDGKIIIGGGFKMFNGKSLKCLARLNADGSIDNTFNIGSGFDNTVEAIAIQSDGKIVVGGNFILYNGASHNRLIRLNTDGTVDNTFNVGSGPNSTVYNIHVLSSGKIIISGLFNSYNANLRSYVAQINANGSIDNTFNTTETYGYAYTSVVQPDEKIIFAGGPCTIGGLTRNYVIRLNSNGTRDMTFQIGGAGAQTIMGLDLQSNGKIIVAGQVTGWSGTNCNRIFRLNTNGSFDSTFYFSTGTNERYLAVKVQDDDKIIGVGVFNWFSGQLYNHILRLDPNGNLDPQFNVSQGTGLFTQPNCIAIQSDKKILIGGNFTSYLNYGRNRIARIINIPSHLINNSQSVCQNGIYSINGHNYTNAGTYGDTLQNVFGGDSIIVTQLTVSPNPTVTISSSYSICEGSSTNITANGAITYTWNTGQTTSNIIVNPTTTTTYTVIGESGNCSDTVLVSVSVDYTCQNVWPGDANSDGTSNNLDILELGLHYTQTGSARSSISNTWQSYHSNNWTGTISNGKNMNHSDCNGDGLINNDDTLAIYNNYSLTHAFKINNTTTTDPQLNLVPDQSTLLPGAWGSSSLFLGEAANSITNINGCAFTVYFDNTLIEQDSIYIEYVNSFIEVSNQNLKFRKLNFVNGQIYTATTHTNNLNASGYGLIAKLYYKIKYPLTQTYTLQIAINDANKSDNAGVITPLTTGSGTIAIVDLATGIDQLTNNGSMLIFPNPAGNILNIKSSNDIDKIQISNLTGQVIITEAKISKEHKLNLENISNGVYFLKVIYTDKQSESRKLIISK